MLEVGDVHKTYKVRDRTGVFVYRRVQAVRGVSFVVHRGENFGIIGESGCGKSTLSRLLSRLEPPDRGSIRYEGEEVGHLGGKRLLSLRRRFQLLLQDPYNAVPPHFPIGHSIGEPLRIHGLASGRALREKVADVMNEVGLSQTLYNELPVGLSAGQRQRVNIARAMVLDPDMLILDETLSALDQVEQAKLLDLFESIQARHRMTYIYISHDLAMVRRVCGRIAVMYLGRVVEDASNQTVFCSSGHPYTRALLSAVPTVEHRPFASETYLLEGEPPDPVNIPPGCSFRTRCPFAFDLCATLDPGLYARGNGEQSACHLMRGDASPHPLFPIDPASSLQHPAFGQPSGESGILVDGSADRDARIKQGEAQ
ncbi:MAG TPA: ABC transporter ATP-binding protein [Acidiphilium sp.]